MTKTYKPAKTLDEQIVYLQNNKRVVYNVLKEDEAKEILLKYNYINVITPYKHKFARLDEKHKVIKIDNKHVYDYDVDFNEYFTLFKSEREVYPIIISNLVEFEINFKSITSYHILTTYNINDSDELENFLNKIRLRLSSLSGKYNEKRINHMNDHIDALIKNIEKYADIYCFFDRMNLGSMLTVYTVLDEVVQNKILNELAKINMDFNVQNVNHFINKVFTAVSIRNCVMHSNSLEILKRFLDPKTHTLRTSTDRKKFIDVIKQLSIEKTR